MSAFSKKEALTVGWNVATNNLWLFIKLGLLALAATIVPSVMQSATQQMMDSGNSSPTVVLVYIVSMLATNALSFIISIGEIKVLLRLLRGEKPRAREIFQISTHQFFSYLFASLLYSLIVLAGLVLLVIPGIIWSIMFCYFVYGIADKDLGPIASLRFSAKITKGNKFNLYLLALLSVLINLAGLFAFGIGLIVTIPTTMIATAYAYQKMVEAAEPTLSEATTGEKVVG